jgi:hypothetical protein
MILRTSLTLATLLPGSLLFAQGAPAAAPRMSDPPAAVTAPSATMRPSLEILKSALGNTNVDRWKSSNAIKGEASANLRSIANDVTNTLPSLLAAADAAPSSPAKVLPAYRNADALYDVLLRVVVSAHLGAPADQSSALDQALQSLEDSRRTLGDQLQRVALSQDTQIGRLQASLRAIPPPQPASPAPEPIKCPAPTTRKHTSSTKAAAKPAAKPSPSTPGASH